MNVTRVVCKKFSAPSTPSPQQLLLVSPEVHNKEKYAASLFVGSCATEQTLVLRTRGLEGSAECLVPVA
jgi:hypothetical protein